jgi:hypothetical protein
MKHAVTTLVVADEPFGATRSCRLDAADGQLVTVL